MSAKTISLFCVQAFLIQYVLSQCIPVPSAPVVSGPCLITPGLTSPKLLSPVLVGPSLVGSNCGYRSAAYGTDFPVKSTSPLAPTGLSVVSENTIEGSVIVGGALPFVSTVVVEGLLPTAGSGAISYECANGPMGIAAEAPISTVIGLPGPVIRPGMAGPICGTGLAGSAFGSGLTPVLGLGLGCCL